METYRHTPAYRALAGQPLFREWQAEHDRIAAAHRASRSAELNGTLAQMSARLRLRADGQEFRDKA